MTINKSTISANKHDNIYNVGVAVLENSIVANGVNGNCYCEIEGLQPEQR